MILLLIALVGFAVPNSFIIYWLLYDHDGVAGMAQNRLALGLSSTSF